MTYLFKHNVYIHVPISRLLAHLRLPPQVGHKIQHPDDFRHVLVNGLVSFRRLDFEPSCITCGPERDFACVVLAICEVLDVVDADRKGRRLFWFY